mgnify:CR=1 FL=1
MEIKSQEKPVKPFFFYGVIVRAQIFRKKYPENTAVFRQKNQPPHPQKTAAGTSKSERLRELNACHMSKISKIFDISEHICTLLEHVRGNVSKIYEIFDTSQEKKMLRSLNLCCLL